MPSEAPLLPTQTEKPHHYTYLKEFRTQQCPLFLQHKCTQHRPFTCFHWHFMNQRRRRPIRKRDATFSYSPDAYCTKYDETTGICPDGDDCPLLHRTAGDTERRYHLRYYKTSVCVHETDSKGSCTKNGPHCAFAHGVRDLRPPVHDVRELAALEGAEHGELVTESPLGTSVEKDRLINEDPKWNDTNYVLAHYKTDPCKRPPRLCRQGYACPSYHNTRDRRRTPKKFKYRSTPCPNVKHGDDWGDPSQCESQDHCPYCHTRTEQQFHPEIYKSSKCNDMVQNGYCPRGPFCAFAHVEQEMTTQREIAAASENSLAAFLSTILPDSDENQTNDANDELEEIALNNAAANINGNSFFPSNATNGPLYSNYSQFGGNLSKSVANNNNVSAFPEPIGKGRAGSFSEGFGFSARDVIKSTLGDSRDDGYSVLKQQMQAIDNDVSLDQSEKSKRKQNLFLIHNLQLGNGALSPNSILNNLSSTLGSFTTPMSPNAQAFYPPGDTVESVIGSALDEDLGLGELSLAAADRDNDTNSVCSSLSNTGGGGFPPNTGSSSSYLGVSSVPVAIPAGSGGYRGGGGAVSPSPPASPQHTPAFMPPASRHLQQQAQQLADAATAFLSQPNPGKFSAPPSLGAAHDLSPPGARGCSGASPGGPGPLFACSQYGGPGGELQRLRDELTANKAKLAQWEEGITQARTACEAWKKEAEEAKKRAKQAEEERAQAYKQRDEAVGKVAQLTAAAARSQCPFCQRGPAGSMLPAATPANM